MDAHKEAAAETVPQTTVEASITPEERTGAASPSLAPEVSVGPIAEPELKAVRPDDIALTQAFTPAAKSPRGRFPLLAASIAGAAAVGSIMGAGAFTLAGKLFEEAPAAVVAKSEPTEEIRELRERVAQLRSGLKALSDSVGGLKGALEASAKANAAQLAKVTEQVTRIGEGVDRTEKAQAEPAARLSKAVEALERLDRRAPVPETTGSIPARNEAPKPAIVEGWVLRRVIDGVAILEGRDRVVEVLPGDTIRGVGRVEDIRRQDGRWVVVTAKGLITAR